MPCFSIPFSSTHQHTPMDGWHWTTLYPPSGLHEGTNLPGACIPFHPRAAWRSFWHVVRPAAEEWMHVTHTWLEIATNTQNYVRCLPIGPHLGVPDVLVLGISRPYLSTHQQNGVPRWHCTGLNPPLTSHLAMDHHGPLGLRNWLGIFIETTGCSCFICRSFWHVVLTPGGSNRSLVVSLVW